MHTINVIDPNTGQAHEIPYDELPHALEAGGQFADEEQKKKAIGIQDGTYTEEPKESKPMELTLTKGKEDNGADWRGLAGDTVRMLGRALHGTGQFLGRVPGNVKEIGSELIHHPLIYPPHVAQQVLAGLGEGAKGLVNIIPEVSQELEKRNFTSRSIPSIPEDTGVEKFLGLEPTKKSDELLRVLPALYGGGKLAGKGLSKIKQVAARPSKEKLFQRALEERVSQAAEKQGVSEAALKGLQDALKLDYSKIHGKKLGDANPVSLQEGINVAESKLAQNKPLTEIPEREVGEIPPEPDIKGMLNEHKQAIENAKTAAEKNLGIRENPRLKAGQEVKKSIEQLHKSSSDLYKAAREHYAGKDIKVDNSKEIKELGKELESLSANEGVFEGTESERAAIESQIKSLEGETVNATDLFDLQRTLEKTAENTRKKQYSGVTDLEFKRLGDIASKLDARANQLSNRLESVGGKDVQKIITEANKGWKTYKGLIKKNPIGKAALKGDIPSNAMIELAKEHPGNEFLTGLIESNPELKKNFLAAYAGESNVNKLLKPSTLTKKYLESLPEVDEHVNALKNALSDYKAGEAKAGKIKREYDALAQSMKDAAKEQKVRQEAIKESDELKKQIQFRKDALPKIEAKMKNVSADSAEHTKLAKELADHKKFIADKGGRLKELAKFFVKVKGANMVHL